VHTDYFGKGEASTLFSSSGFERKYLAAVRGSKVLARLSSTVVLPDKVELATDRPVMIAANHSSLFDLAASLIVLGHYGIPARIGVNSRFFANPVAGAFLRGIGCIAFSKDDRQAAEDEMVDALKRGQPAALMPEGRITREADKVNGVGQGRPGVSRIARRADAAVMPVGFSFANEAWAPGTPLPRPRMGRHKVVARIGPPVLFSDDDHIANANHLMAVISGLVDEGQST